LRAPALVVFNALPFVTFAAAVRFGGAFRLGMGDIQSLGGLLGGCVTSRN
jgi:hypothetical protein